LAAPEGAVATDANTAPFKIIIVGDSSVGKTCLLVRFAEGRYDGTAKPTISVDISSAALDLGSSTVALSLWDTAGQEKFAPLSAPYFRQADGVIIAFDVGARSTFSRVGSYWTDEVFFKADPGASVMLVATKMDIAAEDRQVSTEEAREFAESRGWLYFETSAKSGAHVRDAFYLLACTVMNRLLESDPKNLINDKVDIKGKGPSGKAGCC